jgi:hypothetical protein
MKRKILGMLLVGSASLFVVGCENKKEEEKKEDKTPRIICTQNEEKDGMKSNTTVTLLLRDNTYVKEYKAEVKVTIDDEDLYKIYAEAVKNDSEEETDEDVEYKYETDDASKTITTTIKAVVTDERFAKATDDEKGEMKIKTLVERAESDNGKCEFKNVTRGDVGL